MSSYESFYNGGGYGSSPETSEFSNYRVKSGQVGFPSDPTTMKVLANTSKKISSGTKTVEISGVNITGGPPLKQLSTTPKHHWKEIDRLRKLTGVDFTFHGPLVEPTGFTGRTWKEKDRVEVEEQMKSTIDLVQKANPKGNIVVTFHSSNGIPEVEKRIKEKGKERTVNLFIANKLNGVIDELPQIQPSALLKEKQKDPHEQLKEFNKEQVGRILDNVVLQANRARNEIARAENIYTKDIGEDVKEKISDPMKLYNLSIQNPGEYDKAMKYMESLDPNAKRIFQQGFVNNISDADFLVSDAYNNLKNIFNEAWDKVKPENKKKLEKFRDSFIEVHESYEKDKSYLTNYSEKVNEGVRLLKSMEKEIPVFQPLREFAIDKASDSFANTALHSFKKFKNHSPIISIENPPAGMSGLTRADEIKDLIEASRKKFEERASLPKSQGGLGISRSEAKRQAEKIIGATWDVGHINNIRRFGYSEKDVVAEAKKIAPYVKHMHLADNLGFEDAELPIGMGNVPLKKILKTSENFRNAKKIIETGDWFSSLRMQSTPILEAFEGLGSPVYETSGSPYWNNATNVYGSYFSGLGPINPEVHHSIYQSSFTGLPPELGGQIAGGNRSGFSGTPME
jgi:sugar phosphate isomerase/epimerase